MLLNGLIDIKLIYIICFGFMGGMVGVGLAASLLLFSEKRRSLITMTLFSYAIGTLLGVTFLDLLPNAVKYQNSFLILITVLAGFIFFYIVGRLLSGNYGHNKVGNIVLIGASLHNFIDGVIITAAFLDSIPTGIIVTLSIIAHEIPHEISDFVILLESGFSHKKALIYNIITGISTLFGSVLSYVFLLQLQKLTPFIMALAASSFIYITVSELVPRLNNNLGLRQNLKQAFLIVLGISTIALLESWQ